MPRIDDLNKKIRKLESLLTQKDKGIKKLKDEHAKELQGMWNAYNHHLGEIMKKNDLAWEVEGNIDKQLNFDRHMYAVSLFALVEEDMIEVIEDV